MSLAVFADVLVSRAMATLQDIDIPQALNDSIDRHQSRLRSLASALLDTGQDEEAVRRIVDAAFGSYRDELVKTIMSIREKP